MITHKGTQTIKTERLILRRFTLDDAEEMFKNWANDERVTRFLTWEPHGNLEVTKNLLTAWTDLYGSSCYYNWVIEFEGKAIGNISVVRFSDKSEYADLGYCICYDYWNKGITTEAAKAVINYLFSEVGVNRISISHATRNPYSGKVAQNCGMKYEGTQRSSFKSNSGEFLDISVYSILREEWQTQKEIKNYISLPVVFNDFIEVPELTNGEITLLCKEKRPAIPEKKYVPDYFFEILKDNKKIGNINLRVGYTESLYYGGNIGYGIDEPYRCKGYAVEACKLIIPVIKAHGMKKLNISSEKDNISSKRVCEKLGAKLLRVATVPEWHEIYADGQRYENIFEWSVE